MVKLLHFFFGFHLPAQSLQFSHTLKICFHTRFIILIIPYQIDDFTDFRRNSSERIAACLHYASECTAENGAHGIDDLIGLTLTCLFHRIPNQHFIPPLCTPAHRRLPAALAGCCLCHFLLVLLIKALCLFDCLLQLFHILTRFYDIFHIHAISDRL